MGQIGNSFELLWKNNKGVAPSTIELTSDDFDKLLILTNIGAISCITKGTEWIHLGLYNRPNQCAGGALTVFRKSSDTVYNFYSGAYDFYNAGTWNSVSAILIFPTEILGFKIK